MMNSDVGIKMGLKIWILKSSISHSPITQVQFLVHPLFTVEFF